MPPCAAMLCARRGESWKQKQRTLYPSSLSVAAADAPASPEPTTMTVYFRLFAGFTSFISKRCFSHFRSSGPDGILDWSSVIGAALMDDAGDHAERHDGEAEPDRERETERDSPMQRVLRRLGIAERAERAPCALEEMEAERHHRDEIEGRDP